MAEGSGSGGSGGLYLIVGGLVVAVALGAFLYTGGSLGGSKTTTERTTISVPFTNSPAIMTTTTTTEKK
jgi:hypothetical protein